MSAPVASETPQPVQREQRDQPMFYRRPKTCGDQQSAELVAVQGDGMPLIIHPRPPDMGCWRVLEEFLFNGVLEEPGDGRQPPGHGGAGAPSGFQLAGEALDVAAADSEQDEGAGTAPSSELAQVECVGLAGQAAVPGQETGEREPFGVGEGGLDRSERGGWGQWSSGTSRPGWNREGWASSGPSG